MRSLPRTALWQLVFLVAVVGAADAQTIRTIAGTGQGIDGGEGGAALATSLIQPFDVELGPDGALYICEFGAHRIRRLDLATNQITNFAGTGKAGYSGDGGPATQAMLNQPHELWFDRGRNMYFTDMRNHAIRKIAAETGTITTLAGNGKPGYKVDRGPAKEALVNSPKGLSLGPGGRVYLVDSSNHCLRVIDPKSGTIETIAGRGGEKGFAGDGGPAASSLLNNAHGVGFGAMGEIFIGDSDNHRVRAILPR
jgi:streptogramin lyase